MAKCDIKPVSAFQSTNLSSKIDTFNELSDRILNTLGYPFINIEIHRDSLYTNIQIAVEMFTKFAGYTQEYLLFDSDLYVLNQGIKLDHLFTINTKGTFGQEYLDGVKSPDFTNRIENSPTNATYIAASAISSTEFTTSSALSTVFTEGNNLSANDVIDGTIYDKIIEDLPSLSSSFIVQPVKSFSILGSASGADSPNADTSYFNSYDYDVMDYRKVIAVQDFEEGSSSGVNQLFTIEQTMAQQTYFSYAMGSYGFDLISWYVLKDWMEMREKLLATKRSYTFDDRTQMLRMYPQPRSGGGSASRFYGVVMCSVERPVRDVIKEHWVYQYSLALTKITVANIRGKYGTVTLFGGGSLNSSDLMTQGLAEKASLESMLYEGAPGLGDNEPPMFFVG
jgi:hypothetical protein